MVDQQVEFLADFAEKFKEFSPDHDSFDDFLQDQEIVYQSLQASGQNNRNSNEDHCDQESRYLEDGQSSNAESVELQLAVDEAIARSLMEEDFVDVSISEPSGTAEADRVFPSFRKLDSLPISCPLLSYLLMRIPGGGCCNNQCIDNCFTFKGTSVHNSLEQTAYWQLVSRSLHILIRVTNLAIGVTLGSWDTEVTENAEVRSVETSVAAVNQDNINPDDMTYEELQTLGESIGVESKGLSVKQIASLQHTKFKEKKGFFTTKRIHKE
ncbi:hypothetical protein CK203_035283 [Vitis vinifera]|uniref:Uncharacterized protein n=1 Tax=Vitis vinifera TaxID=29760 RepID=A0A438HN49_VITVI|nr:hypothetical protein CK203_035283 [Vitis vinifera]